MNIGQRLMLLAFVLTLGIVAVWLPGRGWSELSPQDLDQIELSPLSIGSFEVTWTLQVRGYGGYADIVLKENYGCVDRRLGWWESEEGRCQVLLSLFFKGGKIVEAKGANSAGDPAQFGYDGHPPSPITFDPGAIICQRRGHIEVRLVPRIKALNGAAEEVLGCWGENWPAMRLSPAAFRDLALNKKTVKWEGLAMSPQDLEVAPGCQAGLVEVKLFGQLPRVIDSATCKECGGKIAAPAKGETSKKCENGIFDGFRIIE